MLPLGQVIKLSKALSLRMAGVISAGEESFTIVKSGQRQSFSRSGKAREASYGYEYESLAARKKNRAMEPFIVTLHPSGADEPSSHDGQEFRTGPWGQTCFLTLKAQPASFWKWDITIKARNKSDPSAPIGLTLH